MMNLKSYSEGGLHVNDCVSVSIEDMGGGYDTYKGMIIKVSDQLATVLFTDGDVCKYEKSRLRLLSASESLTIGERILKVLENMENLDKRIEAQKAKINGALAKLLQ